MYEIRLPPSTQCWGLAPHGENTLKIIFHCSNSVYKEEKKRKSIKTGFVTVICVTNQNDPQYVSLIL